MARPKTSRGKKKAKASIRDKARQAAETRERGGGGLDTLKDLPQDVDFFKPKMGRGKKGQNRFSIVPYVISIDNHPFQEVGEQWPECTYWQHKIGNGSDQKRFICQAKTDQSKTKKCPICEYRKALLDSGSDPALAEELKPKRRQIFNVFDHDHEDKGIQLLEMSPYMFGFMLDDEDTAQAEDFDDKYYGDDVDGLMVVARFDEGSFGGNKFPECARIDFEERDDLDEEIVESAVDLDASLRILSYDELNEKFFELDTGGEGEEDEEEDEPKTRSKSKSTPSRRRGKATKKEPEPDEDEQEEDEDEDEEDDFPTEDEINKMKSIALKKLIDENELDVDPDGLKLSELRSAVIEECYPDEEDEQEEDEDEEAEDNECPEGMTFGVDCDTEDCCDDCDKWEDCKDLQDEIEEAASKKKKTRSKR